MDVPLHIILLKYSENTAAQIMQAVAEAGLQAELEHVPDVPALLSALRHVPAALILARQPEALPALDALGRARLQTALIVLDAQGTPANVRALQKAGAIDYIPAGDSARLAFALGRMFGQDSTADAPPGRTQTLHTQIGRLAMLKLQPAELFQRACNIFVEDGRFRMAWVGLVDASGAALIPSAWAGEEWGYLTALGHITLPDANAHPAAAAVRTGMPVISANVEGGNHEKQAWQNEALKRGFHSMIAMPIRRGDVTVGVLNLCMAEPNFFSPDEVTSLQGLTPILDHALGVVEASDRQFSTELKLKHTREQLDFHLHNSPLGVIEFDGEYKITLWSGQAAQMFGWQASEVLGRRIPGLDGGGQAFRAGPPNEDESVRTSSNVVTSQVRRKDGRVITCQWHNSALYNPQGRLVSLLSQVLDISDRLHMEEALRENENKFRLLVEHSPGGIQVVDSTGRVSGWNHAQERLTGISRAEVMGKPMGEVLPLYIPAGPASSIAHSGERVSILDHLRTGNGSGLAGSFEMEIQHADGTRRWVEMRSFVLKSLEGLLSVQVCNDITARKQAEAAVRKNARQLELVFNANSDLMVFFEVRAGDSLVVQMYNQACQDFLTHAYAGGPKFGPGLELGQFLTFLQLTEEQNTSMLEKYHQAQAKRRPVQFEMDFSAPAGAFSLEVNISPVLNEAGECSHILLTASDITGRKRMQNELNESNQRFYNAFELAGSGMSLVSLEGAYLKVNPALCRMLGYLPEEMLGKKAADCTHADDVEIEKFALQQVEQGFINRFEIQKRYIHKDGGTVWALLNASLVRDEHLQALYFIHQITNITSLKEAEQTLRLQSAALEHAANAIVITDTLGNIAWANPAWVTLTGYDRDESYGANMRMLKSGWNQQETYRDLWNTINGGATWQGELINKRKDGSVYTEFEIITPVKDDRGQTTHFVAIKQDITERKRYEVELLKMQMELEQRVKERTQDLQKANLALKKAARMKDEFLASMSHELRTPLTGILGLSEALQMSIYGTLTEQQGKTMKLIESSGRHLLSLINDMLDLSKIEAGRLELQFELCSMGQICQSSLQLVKGMANQKHQKLGYAMSPDSILIRADARRVKQMLVNLLGNAIKFTPDGGRLGVEVREDGANQEVRITVWDEGIGIREKDMPLLFQPFVQLDSRLARQYEGTGLGLSLVHHLADLHHGRVEVSSIFGKGSRFTVVLPALREDPPTQADDLLPEQAARPAAGRAALPEGQGPLVLLADDSRMVQELVHDFLESRGYRVVCTGNGEELLAQLEQAGPDVILLDVQMPGLNGLEVMRRIRSHADARTAGLPIIAVTALAMPGDRERCLQAGANAYLSKPVRLAELEKLVASLLENSKK